MKHLDLFSGVGGFALAAQFLGLETIQFVEIDPFCQQVLNKNFPNVPIHADVTTYRGILQSADIITGGFPCQDLSIANRNRRGLEGDRSVLFYEAGRIIHEVRPLGFCLENVTGIYPWMPNILEYFAQIGLYELRWFNLSLEQLGGVHKRNRVFILGKLANAQGLNGRPSRGQNSQGYTNSASLSNIDANDRARGESQSIVCDQNDGLSRELAGYLMKPSDLDKDLAIALKPTSEWERDDTHKLKALGNAVTPQQAYIALATLFTWLQR